MESKVKERVQNQWESVLLIKPISFGQEPKGKYIRRALPPSFQIYLDFYLVLRLWTIPLWLLVTVTWNLELVTGLLKLWNRVIEALVTSTFAHSLRPFVILVISY